MERAEAFDKYELLKDYLEWDERRAWLREAEWSAAQEMIILATSSLRVIVAEHEQSNQAAIKAGTRPKKRLPLQMISKLLTESSRLGRMASEMATSSEQIELLLKERDIDTIRKARWEQARIGLEIIDEGAGGFDYLNED